MPRSRKSPPVERENPYKTLSELPPPEVSESPLVDLRFFRGNQRERHLAVSVEYWCGKRSRRALFNALSWLELRDLNKDLEREDYEPNRRY
jgi:hypothetical protein